MVHSRNHGNDHFTICKGQNGNFGACHEFFDNDMVTGSTEYFIRHHGTNCILCLFFCFCNDNTFTQCQAIRFDYCRDGCCFQICQRFIHIIEYFVSRCGDTIFFHQVFGINLAAFQDSSFFIRTEARDTRFIQGINHAQNQRVIGCYYCEVDSIFFCESHNAFNIFCTDIHACCVFSDTAVTGQRVQCCYFGIFFDFLDDSVLSAATTDHHYFHGEISFQN